MKRIRTILTSVLLLGAFALAGCGTGQTGGTDDAPPLGAYTREGLAAEFLTKADGVAVGESTVTFTDASGTEPVTVAKNPQNVMNLYASFTTLWYEAGGTVKGLIGGASSVALYEEQIGRDITQDEGVEIISASSAGKNWSTEAIVAKRPDLIICSTAMSGYASIQAPARVAGIPVIAVAYDDFQDYLKWFKVFSALSGHPALWDTVALKAMNDIIDILLQVPTKDNPRIFSMFSGTDSLQANLSGTVVGDIAKQLRAVNIADTWFNAAGANRLTINLESVYVAAPAYILVQCHAEDEEVTALVDALYGDDPIWNALDAVKDGKVYFLQKTLFHNKPNRKFVDAYKILAEILYPDAVFA